jgi:Na+/H+ antiporter NhaD/arsenite permease-like protein
MWLNLPCLLAAETSHVQAEPYQTWIFASILVVTLALLALEKIQKTVLVLISAGLCLMLGSWFWGEAFVGPRAEHHLPVYATMIEWEVIGIVIGATVFVEVAARSGVFTWVSIRILKTSRGDPLALLFLLSILTVIFSAFLDNITAMIIVGSLTVVACRKLGLDAKPFLITEGIMTNVGGLLTLISSLPNVIVGKAAGISYGTFLMVSAPYVLLAIVLSVATARVLFGSAVARLKSEDAKRRNLALVEAFDEWETVADMRFFYTSIVGVIGVVLGFALKDQIPILRDFGIEIVAMGAAVIMLLLHAKDIEEDLEKVEWSLVFFFIGLFTIIGVMEHAEVLLAIGNLLDGVTRYTGHYGLMWLTAIFSSVTDNIPLSAMLAKIFAAEAKPAAGDLPTWANILWWAIIFGANLGGNITPIGSASTVVACTILKKNDVKLSFMGFVKFGAVFAVLQLLLATLYLWLLSIILPAIAGGSG